MTAAGVANDLGAGYRGKRVLDVALAAAAAATTLPFQFAVAVAVRLSSSGPILHRAVRVGRHGRPFVLYKFRSMRTGRPGDGPAITIRGDSRITKVGHVLRRSKLDEIPQLYNVLKGDMSIVGPRPEDQRYVDRYTDDQRVILTWRPGITSPASVSFRHEDAILTDADDLDAAYADVMAAKLSIDLEYLPRATLGSDLRWIGRTVIALFSGHVRGEGQVDVTPRGREPPR